MLVSVMAQRVLPAWLAALTSPPVYNSESLYQLCVNKVKTVYRDFWDETDILPRTVKNDLLESWLLSEDVCEDTRCADMFLSHISSWEELKPIDPQIYVALMNHPFEVPRFGNEENHVVKRYIHWAQPNRNVRYKILCPPCFNYIAKPARDWSGNWWNEMGWIFHAMVNHSVIPGDMLLYEIWATEAWCSRCITGTLLDIYSANECSERSEFHMVEGVMDQFNSGRLHGNFISEREYADVPASDKY